MTKRCVFDIEGNGFLRQLTEFWCAGIIDLDTEEEFWFRPNQFQEFLDKLDEYDVAAAHNGAGYDEYASTKLAKLKGISWEADPKKFRDTLIMSKVLKYKRFNDKDTKYQLYRKQHKQGKIIMGDSHSLARWGIHLGLYKGEWKDFSQFSEGMFEYMKQDVRIMVPMYKQLHNEILQWIKDRDGNRGILDAIEVETDLSRISTEQHLNGWLLDKKKLPDVMEKIRVRMKEISDYVNPRLGLMTKRFSGDKTGFKSDKIAYDQEEHAKSGKCGGFAKQRKVMKNGKLCKPLVDWFGIPDDATNKKDYGIGGNYCRVEFVEADIGNTEAVKKYLYSIGWEPDEWNGKWVIGEWGDRKWKRTSPKITASSLEHLEGAGEINEFYTLRSRLSIMEGWEEYIDDSGRLHGDCFNIGTPTFRQTHSVIVNLPSGKAVLGPEVRGLFVSEPGWSIVSADSAACQLRLLSHYMDDDDFLRELLDGDMHQKNADILTQGARSILKSTTVIVSRPDAKPFIFAFLYGAGGPKLAKILKLPEKVGNELKPMFQAAYPKLDKLIKKVQRIVNQQGFIIGLDDRPIYCESKHKALNYLIQGAEAVVMKATVANIWKRFKEENLAFRMLLFYHDEVNIEVRNDHVERAQEIIREEFMNAPKKYGVDIMVCGDCVAGRDYFEVH